MRSSFDKSNAISNTENTLESPGFHLDSVALPRIGHRINFLILNSIKNAPDAKRYPKGQLKKYGPKSVEAVARRERPRPRW